MLGTVGIAEYGAPIGSLACNVTVVLLNFALMLRYAKNTENALVISKCFVKPFVSSVLAIGASYAAYVYASIRLLSEVASLALAIAVAIPLYCLLAFLLGVLSREDIKMIPILKNLVKEK